MGVGGGHVDVRGGHMGVGGGHMGVNKEIGIEENLNVTLGLHQPQVWE